MMDKDEVIQRARREALTTMAHPEVDGTRYDAATILLHRLASWEEEKEGGQAGTKVTEALHDLRQATAARRLNDDLLESLFTDGDTMSPPKNL